MTNYKYSKARVVSPGYGDYKYEIQGWNGKEWVTENHCDWLWWAKIDAEKLLKSISDPVVYEVSNDKT